MFNRILPSVDDRQIRNYSCLYNCSMRLKINVSLCSTANGTGIKDYGIGDSVWFVACCRISSGVYCWWKKNSIL